MINLNRLVGLLSLCLTLSAPGIAKQASDSLDELTALAKSGDSAAQFDLGNRYLYGNGVQANEFEAARWYREAAQQDNHNAQYNLAVMTMQGKGVIADMSEAVNWFERAAALGDAPSQFTLATFYANGRVLPRDPIKAHMWFTLAASAGHKSAAANLVLYQEMLSDAQIAQAQLEANEWIERFNAMHQASQFTQQDEVALP